jgi:hypothetical protein
VAGAAKIFVNYRRLHDSGWPATAIQLLLEREFGADRVFLDVKNVVPADDWAATIRENLANAAALVVLMGDGWHKVANPDSGDRRILDEDDWVREEIRTALVRDIPIFILLVDGGALPDPKWLPGDIRGLLRSQPIRRDHEESDLARVFAALEAKTGLRRTSQPAPAPARPAAAPRPGVAQRPRSPISLAIEAATARIPDAELLAAERHLTITLRDDQLAALRSIHDRVAAAASPAALIDLGVRAWRTLVAAAPKLDELIQHVAAAEADGGAPQPIAWTGRLDLLAGIHRAILLACRDPAASPPFVTTAHGAHYFHPLADDRGARRMQRRSDDARVRPRISRVDPSAAGAPLDHELAVVVADDLDPALRQLVELLPRQPASPTRVVLGFGAPATPAAIQAALAVFPCVAVGGPRLGDPAALAALDRALGAALKTQAVPVALAQLRATWIAEQLAAAGRDFELDRLRDALEWTTWSWVGRPLFADELGEIDKPAYPHLMDLRDVASRDWYYPRSAEMPDLYQTGALTTHGDDQRFHLYLSGAGGTGKSCFLRSIHDTLEIESRETVLAVWYKVHAPSSPWNEVEAQVKAEIRAALARRSDALARLVTAADDAKQLGTFVLDLLARLRAGKHRIERIAIFIDQLERTFESGENPDLHLLTGISNAVVALLKKVGTDQGVRVFVASRKQYLADFLSSFDAAATIKLHFNVLQTLPVDSDGVSFVRHIIHWFNTTLRLAPTNHTIETTEAQLLATKARGHPLNLMLALIDLLSSPDLPTEISTKAIEARRPWERRFHVDEALMGQDDLGWYFFLAMAHARTEIVRREEVIWRLGLANRDLAGLTESLPPEDVIERLWLRGHLGRTLHPRPLGKDSSRLLEFFHANLRDHLLTNVMNRAEDDDRRGMPPAWRALDRLRDLARDWEEVQQPLSPEDITVLMDHKRVFLGPVAVARDQTIESFCLLFMRDLGERRDDLVRAAKECVAYSALVHDVDGRSAFKALFPTVSPEPGAAPVAEAADVTQVGRCRRWLRLGRTQGTGRFRILHYLVELRDPHANRLLAEQVFDLRADADAWQPLAEILAEPLVAATHRSAFLIAAVLYLVDKGIWLRDDNKFTDRLGAFLVAACGGDRDEVGRLLGTLPEEARLLDDPRIESALQELLRPERVARWSLAPGGAAGRTDRDRGAVPSVELRIGDALAAQIDDATVARWTAAIAAQLGVPIPAITRSRGEVSTHRRSDEASRPPPPSGHELELAIRGRLIALGRFFPDRIQTLTRDWNGADAPGAIGCYNEAIGEPVRWVEAGALDGATWRGARWAFDAAVTDWLAALMRRYVAAIFDHQDVYGYLTDVARAAGAQLVVDLPALSNVLAVVRDVITRLVRERAPVAERRVELLSRMFELLRERDGYDVIAITRTLREEVRDDLCRGLADAGNQLIVVLLERSDEDWLTTKLVKTPTRLAFEKLAPEELRRLVAQVRDRIETVTRADGTVPVLVCADHLRAPLFELLQRFDPRIFVLSYTELSPDVRRTWRGVVRRFAPSGAAG